MMEFTGFNDDIALKTLRWGLVLTAFLVLVYRHRDVLDRYGLLREMALVIFAWFAYFAVRGLTVGSEAEAVANAARVIEFEQMLGIFREPAMQEAILEHRWLVDFVNVMYVWGHWPLIIPIAVWLYLSHNSTYRLYRNAFIISGSIGLVVFALFPVAPPRLAEIEIVDTVTQHSNSYRVLQPPGLVNQYAAVPSLHFGWNLLIGIILVTTCRSLPAKALGATVPLVMFMAIVLSANHYIIDAAAGGVVALIGLAAAYALRQTEETQQRFSTSGGGRAGG